MTQKNPEDREFKRERQESDTERRSDFPCPCCASRDTLSYTPQDVIHKNRVDKNTEWPIIIGTGLMPNYIRYRRCTECEAAWQTCESVVIHSVKNKAGEIVS